MLGSGCRFALLIRPLAPAVEAEGPLVMPGICGRMALSGVLPLPIATDLGCMELDLPSAALPGRLAYAEGRALDWASLGSATAAPVEGRLPSGGFWAGPCKAFSTAGMAMGVAMGAAMEAAMGAAMGATVGVAVGPGMLNLARFCDLSVRCASEAAAGPGDKAAGIAGSGTEAGRLNGSADAEAGTAAGAAADEEVTWAAAGAACNGDAALVGTAAGTLIAAVVVCSAIGSASVTVVSAEACWLR